MHKARMPLESENAVARGHRLASCDDRTESADGPHASFEICCVLSVQPISILSGLCSSAELSENQSGVRFVYVGMSALRACDY